MTGETTKSDRTHTVNGDRPSAELLNVKKVASLLGISARQVYRLADSGKLPRPVRLGALVRWRKTELHDWIAEGCKPANASREVRR